MFKPAEALKMAQVALKETTHIPLKQSEILDLAKGILVADGVYQGIKYAADLIMKGDFQTGKRGSLSHLLKHLQGIVSI